MPVKETRPKDPAPRKRHRLKIQLVPLTPEYDEQATLVSNPEDILIRQEQHRELHKGLTKIPLLDRELLELRYRCPPTTLRELACARGVSEEAIRRKIVRLLKGMRAYLKRRERTEARKIQTAVSSLSTFRTK